MKSATKSKRTHRPRKGHLTKRTVESALAGLDGVRQGNKLEIVYPTNDAAKRYGAIPLLFGAPVVNGVIVGRVAYDSWQQGLAPALRDVMDGHLRRLTLKAGRISVELIAERTHDNWEFVARVYSSDKVRYGYVLRVGRRKLLPGSGGYFHWSSRLAPCNIELLSYEQNISFERLSWQ